MERDNDIAARAACKEAQAAAGGATALARLICERFKHVTISPQAVWQWKMIPADRVLMVETVTGVSRHRLRPDLYPQEVGPISCPVSVAA
jgi:DNA-binding transcriptional regulator YdaS (Cro superfamily)